MALDQGLTPTNWIAIVAILVPLTVGFIGWMTHIAVIIGKVAQKIDTFTEVTSKLREDIDKHSAFELRIVKLESALATRMPNNKLSLT